MRRKPEWSETGGERLMIWDDEEARGRLVKA